MARYDDMQTTGSSVEREAKDTVDRVKEKTSEVAHKAEEQAKSALASQKSQAAQELQSVAQAFRKTSEQLRQEQQGNVTSTVAHYADSLANQVDRFSEQIRQKNIDELMHDAQDLARRQPAIFLGGAFAAGILLGRFFKSSGQRPHYNYQPGSSRHIGEHRPTTAMYGYSAETEHPEVYSPTPGYPDEFSATGERSVTGERADYGK